MFFLLTKGILAPKLAPECDIEDQAMPGFLEIIVCVIVGVGAFVATKIHAVKINFKDKDRH